MESSSGLNECAGEEVLLIAPSADHLFFFERKREQYFSFLIVHRS
jgi:hypothetical protein